MTTLFHTTMTALEQSLTCALIASDIAPAGVLPFSGADHEIMHYALKHRFTRVPLWETVDGVPSHVAIVDLETESITRRRPISPGDLIAGSTPIGKAILLIDEREFCFVLVEEKIQKILTRSDLNKLPIRVYLTTLLAHVEGLLADTIDVTFPNDTWLDLLSPNDKEKIEDLFREKVRGELDTRKIDCTLLSQKSEIIRNSEALINQINLTSTKAKKQGGRINNLRNRIFHGLPPLSREEDIFRNQLYHQGPVGKKRDVQWLVGVVNTIQEWIKSLTEEPQENTTNDA